MFPQSVDKNIVNFLQQTDLFACQVTDDSHCQSGAWERMAVDELRVHPSLVPYLPHFILEQAAEGFNYFQFQVFGQSAHIMM